MFKQYFNSLIINWKEQLYLLSLGAFLVALPTSIALISITAVTLLLVWFLTGDYKTKWNRLIHNKNALLLMSIPLIYLIGLCFTHDFALGKQEFNKSFYWFIFAFVLGSSLPVSYKNSCRLLGIYMAAVTVAAGVAFTKLFFFDTVTFSDFRKVAWIDHIPFSFQIAFVIWLVLYFIIYGNLSSVKKSLLFLLILFLITTLVSLKSVNGYLYFGAMSVTALLMFMWKARNKILKFTLLTCVILVLVLPAYYLYHCVHKFYDITEHNITEIEQFTVNGNPYKHNFENKVKENGHYIDLFLCEEELIPLWNAHSSKSYNSKTLHGYSFSSVIIRYMTSKGLTKDSAGFAQLSQKDIANIENEIPNYIYAENKLSIYPRIYETIWEIDLYRMDKNPNGKSFAQRIEQAILAVAIIKKHFWLGVGLGNNALAYKEVTLETGSKLEYQLTGSAHNQYLNYLIRFGILGALYILGVLFWVFFKERKNNPILITIFFVSMLVANFGEANWETFIGLNYFAFFICFLMWIMPKDFLKN